MKPGNSKIGDKKVLRLILLSREVSRFSTWNYKNKLTDNVWRDLF